MRAYRWRLLPRGRVLPRGLLIATHAVRSLLSMHFCPTVAVVVRLHIRRTQHSQQQSDDELFEIWLMGLGVFQSLTIQRALIGAKNAKLRKAGNLKLRVGDLIIGLPWANDAVVEKQKNQIE